jgi:RHS repeat-associated protein
VLAYDSAMLSRQRDELYDTAFGFNQYEAHYRDLDAELGRWIQIDPEPRESESPYSSMGNNPVSRTDFLGNADDDCCGGVWQAIKDWGNARIENDCLGMPMSGFDTFPVRFEPALIVN